jgi:hypothetical protein
MLRTPVMAAAALALMSSAAFAQGPGTAGAPPAQLSGGDSNYDDQRGPPPAYDDRSDDRGPPPGASGNQAPPQRSAQAQDQRRDLFCRRDAAARTGYVTPGEAASREQTNGSVGGTVAGAALGAIIGGASHAAGAGALIGAGAGLIAGTAIGSDNARHAASDVERAYGDAYEACMSEADDRDIPSGRDYAYGAYGPPPPRYYAPYPYYYPPPIYYGPSVSFGFGFGGYRGFHGGGFRGFHR